MKVLFLTNGLGLGNSTRCHAIIQRLHEKGASVEVVTSGNGLWYFSDKPEVTTVHEIASLAYGSKDGAISIWRTFASAGQMLKVIRGNAKLVGDILDTARPDVVVSDSDYNFLPIKKRKLPLVALNNADVVRHSYFALTERPDSVRAQFYGVEMQDYFFHKLVPDLVISPTLDPAVRETGAPFRRVGPIVRRGYERPERGQPTNRVAVMLSGSVFGTPVRFEAPDYPVHIDVIGRDMPDGWSGQGTVTFHGKIKDTYPLLAEADLAVINGGFSAVSEMFWMGKPMIVVPVPRHAEQWVNARTIEHLGVGRIASQEGYEGAMLDALDRLSVYAQSYDHLPEMQDGAEQAAQAILEIAAGRR